MTFLYTDTDGIRHYYTSEYLRKDMERILLNSHFGIAQIDKKGKIKMNICLCTKYDSYRIRKNFESYEELLIWTQEQIEVESKINIDDIVEIISEGKMYTTLSTDFFTEVYWASHLSEEKMFDIIRYYKYDYKNDYNGIKGKVICKYDNKYILEIPAIDNLFHEFYYIVIGKEGVKKVNA